MRICFSAIPAYGHVFPMVPLAEAAADAGHEVLFVAGSAFDGRLPVPVVPGVPEGMTLQDAEAEARSEVRDPSEPFAWPMAMFGVVMPRYIGPRLLEYWEGHGRPDLVIHEGSNIGAKLAAAQAGIPSLGFHISLSSPGFFLRMLETAAGIGTASLVDPRPPTWRGDESADFDLVPLRSVAWSEPSAPFPAWLTTPASGPTGFLTLGTVAFGAVEVLRRSILETAARCARVLVAAGPEADVDSLGELDPPMRLAG